MRKIVSLALNVVIITLLHTYSCMADKSDVRVLSADWRFYGGVSPGLIDNSACFYNSDSIELLPEGHVRVWVKCLREQEIRDWELLDDTTVKFIFENTARKILENYLPPIDNIKHLDKQKISAIIFWEVIANFADLSPTYRIFYEFDCRLRRERELKLLLRRIDGEIIDPSRSANWDFIASENDLSVLFQILCSK